MTRKTRQPHLTEFDFIVIRAGGRTQTELEAAAFNTLEFRCRMCAFLADNLYQVVMRLEASANRSAAGSHRRFIANVTP
jgi:hypothetical protein